jgi:hypothetical protein
MNRYIKKFESVDSEMYGDIDLSLVKSVLSDIKDEYLDMTGTINFPEGGSVLIKLDSTNTLEGFKTRWDYSKLSALNKKIKFFELILDVCERLSEFTGYEVTVSNLFEVSQNSPEIKILINVYDKK